MKVIINAIELEFDEDGDVTSMQRVTQSKEFKTKSELLNWLNFVLTEDVYQYQISKITIDL